MKTSRTDSHVFALSGLQVYFVMSISTNASTTRVKITDGVLTKWMATCVTVMVLGTLGHFVKLNSTNVNRIRVSTEYAVMKLKDTPVSVTSCILASTAMCGLTLVLPFLVNTMASVYWMTKDSIVTAPEPVTPEADVSKK